MDSLVVWAQTRAQPSSSLLVLRASLVVLVVQRTKRSRVTMVLPAFSVGLTGIQLRHSNRVPAQPVCSEVSRERRRSSRGEVSRRLHSLERQQRTSLQRVAELVFSVGLRRHNSNRNLSNPL